MSNKPKVAKTKKGKDSTATSYYRDVLGVSFQDAKLEQFVKWAIFQHEAHGFGLDSCWFFDNEKDFGAAFSEVVDSLNGLIDKFVVDGNMSDAINHLHGVNNRMPKGAELSMPELYKAYQMIRMGFEAIVEAKEKNGVIDYKDFDVTYGDNQYPNGKRFMIRFMYNPALFGFASAETFGFPKQTRIF
jgi:hypothetical protein